MSKQPDGTGYPVKRGGVFTKVVMALLAAVLLATSLAPGLAAPAKAQETPPAQPRGLAATGPIDPENGFPFWYEDNNGTRLELCLNPKPATAPEDAPNAGEQIPGGGYCLTPFEMPDENAPMVFPDNFPGEAFWWTGEAHIDRADGGRAMLVLAQEAAFANENPKEGDQMSFGRVRIRLDQLVPGATYKVTHPYGVDELVAEEDGSIFVTEDIGCFPSPITPCDFDKALDSRIGPFLTWDTFGTDGPGAPPAGHVGDPDVPHKVVGSPLTDAAGNPQNYFKVEGPAVGGPGVNVIETDLFAVTGKVAELQVKAVGAGAERAETVFNDPDQKIELVASDPGAEIFYSRNDEPLVDAEGNIVGTPYDPATGITLRGTDAAAGTDTKINFIAVSENGERSEPASKTFQLDLEAPNLTFSHPSGVLEGATEVTLKTNEPARIYYTTDGSNPDPRILPNNPARKSFPADPQAAPVTEGTINVARSQTIRAIAADIDPVTGAEVNWSRAKSARYDISNLKAGPINPENGFPFWYEDYGLKNEAGELVRDPVRLDLCLNPVAAPEPGGGYCATPFEMPADWQPSDGVSFPESFPGEAFWFTAESGMDTSEDGEANLIMATEAAFLNEVPKASDRMVFGRIRIRIDDLVAGETYKVTHPYGTDTFVAEPVRPGSAVGEINTTEDIGCMIPSEAEPCDFNEAGFGRVGPYLTLANPALEPTDAPDGGRYLANPVTDEDVVTGSPYGTNFFRVEGPGLQGSDETPVRFTEQGTPYLQTNFFSIVGKRSEFQAAASKLGGPYNAAQNVVLGASEFDARIFYTINGNDPSVTTDANGNPVPGNDETKVFVPNETPGFDVLVPENLDAQGNTTLKYQAYSANQQNPTKVYTETYTLDTALPTAPSIELAPESNGGDKADALTNDTTPTFTGATDAGARVKILVDGVQKGSGRADANGNYSITTSLLGGGDHAITATATSAAGNTSTSAAALNISIDDVAPAAPTATPPGGSYNGPRSVSLTAEQGAEIYYTLGEAVPSPTSTRYTTEIQVNSSETINAIAVDAAGNESELASFDYVIAAPNTAPIVNILSPEPGSTTRDRTPTIRATVRDAQTELRRANIRLVIDGRRVDNRPALGRFSYDQRRDRMTYIPRARLDLGRHTVRVIATDGEKSTPKSWSFRIVRP